MIKFPYVSENSLVEYDIKYIYFLGIGGIGMSALARWFKANGCNVAGYDKTPTVLTKQLEDEGIKIFYQDDFTLIPPKFLIDQENTLVVYTPAVPSDLNLLNYLKRKQFLLLKRSKVLGILTQQMTTLAIAGTHGKTTTTTLLAYLLKESGKNITAFMGGISQNYQTNLLLNEATEDMKTVFCVAEADEYDRSFLALSPQMAVITSTDADHLDIYSNHTAVLESFQEFAYKITEGGLLLLKNGLSIETPKGVKKRYYGLENGDYFATNIHIKNHRFYFDIHFPTGKIKDVCMQVPGFHNIENAVAASALALQIGVTPEQVKYFLGEFKGVKRRFEYHLESEEAVLIDDYAHHPEEVKACLSSVKALYPDKKITVIFQPHLFTRTRDFYKEFAESLSIADQVVLLEIYPARELPIEGVDSELIFNLISSSEKIMTSKAYLIDSLNSLSQVPEVILTMGAGDIEKFVPSLKKWLEKKTNENIQTKETV